MLPFLLAGCVFVLPEERSAHRCEVGIAGPESGDADDDGIADCLDVEECDGLDNDGDAAVDEGLYPDEDGDGYGDETAVGPCYIGWVPSPGDCDDTDARVNAGATVELCDGKNSRCAADWTEDIDVVTLYARDPDTAEPGEPTDLSLEFLDGAAITLNDGDLLNVCPARSGSYDVTIVTATNAKSVSINGVLTDNLCDAATVDQLPTLSGAGGETAVTLVGSARGTRVDIDCLGITGGGVLGLVGGGLLVGPGVTATVSRSAIWGNSGAWFGGVWNQGSVTLDSVVIIDNLVQDAADTDGAGGIRSEGGGTLEMLGGTLSGNESPYSGGGANILEGSASFYGTTFGGEEGGNRAEYRGGALAVGAAANVTLNGVRVVGNGVEYEMGGAVWTAGTLNCQTDDDGVGEIVSNTATDGVGGGLLRGGRTPGERV